jgi:hypothetical protein
VTSTDGRIGVWAMAANGVGNVLTSSATAVPPTNVEHVVYGDVAPDGVGCEWVGETRVDHVATPAAGGVGIRLSRMKVRIHSVTVYETD